MLCDSLFHFYIVLMVLPTFQQMLKKTYCTAVHENDCVVVLYNVSGFLCIAHEL